MKRFLTILALILLPAAPVAAVEVCWDNPSNNVDGSLITNLASVTIHWGVISRTYTESLVHPTTVPGERMCSQIPTLPGPWYFAATAEDDTGDRSAYSNEVMKPDASEPKPPVWVAQPQTVYTVKMQPDRFLLFAVGTVPAETFCDLNAGAPAGYGVVPNDEVQWTCTDPAICPRPIAVVAECDG